METEEEFRFMCELLDRLDVEYDVMIKGVDDAEKEEEKEDFKK